MAEVFGVVASGMGVVSLAFQVADSIKKLKDFYSLMKEAPGEISLALNELEVLSLILEDIDRDLQQQLFLSPAIKAASTQSLRMCAVASKALKAIVCELEKSIVVSKKKGAFKAALKKDMVDMFRKRLESAKSTMLVANQCYHGAMQRQNWESHEQDMIELRRAASVITHLTTFSQPRDDLTFSMDVKGQCPDPNAEGQAPTTSQLSPIRRRTRPRTVNFKQTLQNPFLDIMLLTDESSTTTSISLRLPTWLYSRRFDIALKKSYQGWDQSFRTYKLISSNALVITYSKTGNVAGLQDLFRAGLASPFEADSYGGTPLHYAALHARSETCRFLLANGADANARTSSYGMDDGVVYFIQNVELNSLADELDERFKQLQYSTPLHLLSFSGFALQHSQGEAAHQSPEDEIHAATEALYIEGDSDSFNMACGRNTVFDIWNGPSRTFRWLRQQEDCQIANMSAEDKLDHFAVRLFQQRCGETSILREFIPEGYLVKVFMHINDRRSAFNHLIKLLTGVVENLVLFESCLGHRREWIKVLAELVSVAYQLDFLFEVSSFSVLSYTPFLFVIFFELSCLRTWGLDLQRPRLCQGIREWLVGVAKAGVDLMAYGRRELELHAQKAASWDFTVLSHRGRPDICFYQILYVRIGETPDDWHIEFEDFYVSTGLSRDFWILVEGTDEQNVMDEEMVMPGSWCD